MDRAPSNRNIAENPDRGAPAPFEIDDVADFSFELGLFRTVEIGLGERRSGMADATALVSTIYRPENGRPSGGVSGDSQEVIDFCRFGRPRHLGLDSSRAPTQADSGLMIWANSNPDCEKISLAYN